LIKVKTLNGQLYSLDGVTPQMTIDGVKDLLTQQINAPRECLKLVYKGLLLNDGLNRIIDQNIKDGDFLVVYPSVKSLPVPEFYAPVIIKDQPFTKKSKPETPQAVVSTPAPAEIPQQQQQQPVKKEKKASDKIFIPPPSSNVDLNTSDISLSKDEPIPGVPMGLPIPLSLGTPLIFSPAKKEPEKSPEEIAKIATGIQKLVNSIFDGTKSASEPPKKEEQSNLSASAEVTLPEVDGLALQQLLDMGFPEAPCKKALHLNRMRTQEAMEWLLEHGSDADINEPLTPDQIRSLVSASSSFVPDPINLRRLQDMGFSIPDVTNALRITNNNYESAAAWLLGDRDVEEEEEDHDFTLDESNPIVRTILNNTSVQSALSNSRVVEAMKAIMDDPSSAAKYLNDPEIGPILTQVHNILNLPRLGF